jgi:hypothetical protein
MLFKKSIHRHIGLYLFPFSTQTITFGPKGENTQINKGKH